MDDLLREFIAETRETLEALSGEIVAWEAAPKDRGRLDAVFRFVHMVKGSCGFLNLPALERLSHAAEDALAEVRGGRRPPDRVLVDAVLAVVDRIGATVEALDAGTPLPDTGEDRLIAALAPGAAAVEQPAVAPATGQRRSVRLDVELLDRMMTGLSEMVVARNELARVLREGKMDPAVEVALARLSVSVAEMRETVTRTRVQRVETLFAALPRMVRDTAASLGKAVMLTLEGSDVEIDRDMVETMRDPLVHMIRNAIDHGIESAAERRAAGKPEAGQLVVAARQAGNQIVLEISDDGRGIDVARLAEKLAAAANAEPSMVPAPDRRGAELIFEPGLSVRDVATSISGRGVGMDVVRAAVERIGGRIELDNRPGSGLRIQVQAPLTLSIIPAVVVAVGGQRYAIAREVVEEVVTGASVQVEGEVASTTLVRGRRMPLVDLRSLLGVTPAGGEPPMQIVVGVRGNCLALMVDAVLDHQELVVRPAPSWLMDGGIYAGMILPDNGSPILLLDCAGVATAAGVRFEPAEGAAAGNQAAPADAGQDMRDAPRPSDAAEPTLPAGRLLIDRRVPELIGIDWLLAQVGRAVPSRSASGPLCQIAAPASGALATFVGTLLEQHGYRVVVGCGSSEAPAVVLVTGAADSSDRDGVPVIRLRDRREPRGQRDDSIYRYDSGALLAAVAERTGGTGAVP